MREEQYIEIDRIDFPKRGGGGGGIFISMKSKIEVPRDVQNSKGP